MILIKKYNKYFKKRNNTKKFVTYLINTDTILYNDYQIYQKTGKSINNKDKEIYLNIVHNNIKNKKISKKMKKAFNNLKNIYIKFI